MTDAAAAKVQPLVGKQARSVQLATARLNIWEGSVRSSKTICSLIWWLIYVRTGPAGNLAMIGKTERTLKRNVIDPLIDMVGKKRCKANWGEGELMLFGRRIYLAGANDEKAVDKIRGLTLAGAYVDEISVIPESFWSMLLTRLSIDGAQLGGTTNPDNPNHWLMRDYLKRARRWLRHDGAVIEDDATPLDLARFSFRLADNPTLSASYLAALAAEFTGLWKLRYIDGLWVLAEGAIYDQLDTDGPQLVADVPRDADGRPSIDHWILCVDYGTTNPFVALLIGVGRDDRLYVAAEWRWDSKAQRGQLTDGEYSTRLRTWLEEQKRWLPGLDVDRIYVDPSAASFIAQLWRDGWAGVHGADNAVADGIRNVATLLGGGRLRFVKGRCEAALAEMTGYVWDPKAAAKGEERPLKVDDHGPDALRYGVMGLRRWWRHWLMLELPEAA